MGPKARLWIWLGVPLATISVLLIGVILSYGIDLRPKVRSSFAPVFPLAVVGVSVFGRLRKWSRGFWMKISTLPSTDFRFVLLPHLVACAGVLLCAAALLLDGVSRSGPWAAWYRSTAGSATFTSLTIGGAVLAIFGALWSEARQRMRGLR